MYRVGCGDRQCHECLSHTNFITQDHTGLIVETAKNGCGCSSLPLRILHRQVTFHMHIQR